MHNPPLTPFDLEVMARAAAMLEQPSAERAELIVQTEQALAAKQTDTALAPAQ